MLALRARDAAVRDHVRAAASATGADYRNRIFTVAAEIPFAGHPVARHGGGGGRRARRARGALRAADRRRPAADRGRASRATCSWTRRCSRSPAEFGAEVEPAHVMAAVGLRPGDARPRAARRRSSRPGCRRSSRRSVDGTRSRAPRPTSTSSTRCSRACGDANLYLAWHDGARARAGADVHARWSRVGRTRPPARPPARCAPISPARGLVDADRDRPGRRDGPARAGCVAEIEGDRVRVGGDVVTVDRRDGVQPVSAGAAFFDLDRTLMAGSSAYHFGRALYKAGSMSRRQLARDAVEQIRFRLRGATDAAVNVLHGPRAWRASRAIASSTSRGMTPDVLAGILPRVYPQMLAVVRSHQDAGRPCYIATAASRSRPPTSWPARSRWTARSARAGRCATASTPAASTARSRTGRARPRRCASSPPSSGIDLAQSWAYTDAASDLPMLEAVGHPVAVNPDAGLAEVARRRGLGGAALREARPAAARRAARCWPRPPSAAAAAGWRRAAGRARSAGACAARELR